MSTEGPIESSATIALIGATRIAQEIAARGLRAGCRVIIDDVSDSRLDEISAKLDRDAAGTALEEKSDSAESGGSCGPGARQCCSPTTAFSLANLTLTQSVESAIRDGDFLIDTLPDDVEVKLELFTLFDKFAKPNAIFITTGSIPIDDLAAITFCPERCVAVRLASTPNGGDAFFRLIPGIQTSQDTLTVCTNLFLHSLGFGKK